MAKHHYPVEHQFAFQWSWPDECWICTRPKNQHPPKSSRRMGRGRHRGEYKPSFHWAHEKCYENGVCRIKTETAVLHFYSDLYAPEAPVQLLPDSQGITFSSKSDPSAV